MSAVMIAAGAAIPERLAAFHKILPLRTDDLLIDRLFEAVEARLRHA
jgi:hypothetical protein